MSDFSEPWRMDDRNATRAGFIAVAGRPNAGKSTLVNCIVGKKVSIVSDKPQTTRREIRGIATIGQTQLVLVDLPGVQRPRDAMTDRMQRRVEHAVGDADAVLFVLNGDQEIGKGDRYIARSLRAAQQHTPVVMAMNKIDRMGRTSTVEALAATADLNIEAEVFPISARTGEGVPVLVEHLSELMPAGPLLYPGEAISDQEEHVLFAELVREQVLRRTREEIPHAVEAEVLDVVAREDGLISVTACLWTEGQSQKGILIGRQGRMVKAIGIAARKEIEEATGTRVHLDLQVRVRQGWRGDDTVLDRLGIE